MQKILPSRNVRLAGVNFYSFAILTNFNIIVKRFFAIFCYFVKRFLIFFIIFYYIVLLLTAFAKLKQDVCPLDMYIISNLRRKSQVNGVTKHRTPYGVRLTRRPCRVRLCGASFYKPNFAVNIARLQHFQKFGAFLYRSLPTSFAVSVAQRRVRAVVVPIAPITHFVF